VGTVNTSEIADVAVIGAGIIGTTIAERLQHEGKRVLLIDRQAPGLGCSQGNAGHFASDVILPLANFNTLLGVPKMLLDPLGPLSIKWSYFPQLVPWLMRYTWAAMPHKTRQSVDALKVLNRPSIARFKDLLKRTSLEYLMTQKGALTVYHSAAAANKNRQHAQFVSRHGVNVEQLNGDEVRELEPAVAAAITGGLYYPDTAHTINPYQLVASLADYFMSAGGQFVQQEVMAIQTMASTHVVLKTKGADIVAKEVVIAGGAWSKALAKMVGHTIPLETERGYHLMLPTPKVELTRPVTSFERSFVMTPMQEGLRLAGTVELAGLNAPENEQRAKILLNHAKEVLPQVDGSEGKSWMGHRPSLPDSLPIIGRSPKHERVLFAFGHQHLGLTQAAVTADLISEAVLRKPHQVDITPFRVDRF
jgi:glycine/D-amino acid oxidase-like deaminating enzyme